MATREEARAVLTDYERGFLEALELYAWWKSGVQYVGSTGRTFNHAARGFLLGEGRTLELVDALYPIRNADAGEGGPS